MRIEFHSTFLSVKFISVASRLAAKLKIILERHNPISTTSCLSRPQLLIALPLALISGAVPYPSAAVQVGDTAEILRIRTISGRADMVSGGDVLVDITFANKESTKNLRVTLNTHDVTGSFRAGPTSSSLLGLVAGLTNGRNTLVARGSDGRAQKLTVINHPITGPIFSGPQQTPFVCETDTFELQAIGGTLGRATDPNCSAATKVSYIYKSADGSFKPLPDGVRPADLARTTTSDNRDANYIVRLETGTINRAIYQLAILHDPAKDPPVSPWTRPDGWNRKLIYTFGGGGNPGYHQGLNVVTSGGRLTLGTLNDVWLSRGYAVAASTLNVNGVTDNTVISAETAMMVKEHFIETFGAPRFTIGAGGSGGSMQVHEVAEGYPGILDGIIASGFADTITTVQSQTDCSLLERAFRDSAVMFTRDQMTAVSGYGDWRGCEEWINLAAFDGQPTNSTSQGTMRVYPLSMQLLAAAVPGKTLCSPVIPRDLIYDRTTNPKGARCTYQDNSINIFGRDKKSGFALRPFDNVGVQYGLLAFNEGKITSEQFVQLNEHVGGYDIDGNLIKDRYAADLRAVRMAYVSGRVVSGRGFATIPVIDEAWPSAPNDYRNGRISMFSLRDRLSAANGNADNEVILTAETGPARGPSSRLWTGSLLVDQMDHWLENILADDQQSSVAGKIVRNKPPDLVDACYKVDRTKISEVADRKRQDAVCNEIAPIYRNPRLAAGSPIANDTLKCRLKPLDSREYANSVTPEQMKRLKNVFPLGVCDYNKPGVGKEPLQTWLVY